MLLVGPDHHLATQDVVTVEQVRDEPFVCFPGDNPQRAGMDRTFTRIGFQPSIAFECDAPKHLQLVLNAGMCCLGLRAPTKALAPRIRCIPFDIETPITAQVLALPDRLRRSVTVQAMADALLRALRA